MAGRRRHTDPDGHVRVGQIVGPFGLRGGIKVELLTDFSERFDVGSLLYLDGEPHTVLESYRHKTQARIVLEGISALDLVERLKWRYLTVPSSDRPELDADEYLVSDLLGMGVIEDGALLGTVDEVVHTPAQDLLRVGDVLIPCVRAFVKRVDLVSRTVEVELIEGMRPGETPEEAQ